ncbi:MAG: glycosyltransferase [Balneolaceae bacterium]
MKTQEYTIAFFGSSLVSAYWNGAATYYRGIIKALHNLGHQITFFEPDAFDRQQHRDIPDPDWAKVVVYQPKEEDAKAMLSRAKDFDIVVKANGIGILDTFLATEILKNRQDGQRIIYWDVDAPATLSSMRNEIDNTLRDLIPEYDLVLTYGGGQPVIDAYEAFGAQRCVPVYNALDPDTHHPVPPKEEFRCDLGFLGNRLPDREKRVENFFLKPANSLPEMKFLLGGNGWEDKAKSENVNYIGHVYTKDHNAFNTSSKAVLNISRDSMAEMGFSPATRVFEAAGAGACLITDYWEGIEMFVEPDKEVLVARNGNEVTEILSNLSKEKAKAIGEAALKRMLAEHTYDQRAVKLTKVLQESFNTSNVVIHAE